jgi:hypothetical protein
MEEIWKGSVLLMLPVDGVTDRVEGWNEVVKELSCGFILCPQS